MNQKQNSRLSLRKLMLTSMVAAPLAITPAQLWALPSVAAGNLTTSTGVTVNTVSPTVLQVNAPDRAVLTWVNFGSGTDTIGAADVINYTLPSASANVLNRVTGGTASTINGTINSNGNVWVLNTAGIIIGANANIDVAGFYASTKDDTNASLLFGATGALPLTGPAVGDITVQGGAIRASGSGNNIRLYANDIVIEQASAAGNAGFYGNTFLNASATAGAVLGSVTIGSVGQVDFAQTNVPLTGGNLTVNSNGGAISISTVGATNVVGTLTLDSTGSAANGNISANTGTTTGTRLSATSGTVTINAGLTGAVDLSNVNFATVAVTNAASTIIRDRASGLAVGNVVANGNLVIEALGGQNITSVSGTSVRTNATVAVPAPTIDLTGNSVTFVGAGNVTFGTVAATTTANLSTTNGNIGVNNAATIPFLTITASNGTISTAALTSSSTITLNASGNISHTGNISASQLNITSSGGSLTALDITTGSTSNISISGNITANALTATGNNAANYRSTNGTLTAASYTQSGTGAKSLRASGNVTLTGAVTQTAGALTLTSDAGTVSYGSLASATTAATTISAAGNIQLAATTAPVLNVTSTAGSISQTGIITSTSRAVFDAPGSITLTSANLFNNVGIVKGASVTISDADAIVIGTGTNTTGAVTINATGITLGAAVGDSLIFGGTLALNSNGGAVTTVANTVRALGAITVTSGGGAVTLGADPVSGAGNYSFGQINVTAGAGNVTLWETQTLNLGTIQTGGNLMANSSAGNIINTGNLTVGGTTTVSAGTFFAPLNVSLTNSANQLVGAVVVENADAFAVSNTVNTTVQSGAVLGTGRGIIGSAIANTTGGGSLTFATNPGGSLRTIGGSVSGALVAGTMGTPIAGNLTIENLTVTGGGTISVVNTGILTLGSGNNISTTGLTSLTSIGANASIVDGASNISISGPLSLTSDNSIALTRSGHSFGPLTLQTTAANGATGTSNITVVEGATLNLAGATIAGNGNLTLTSTGGSIIQSAGAITVPFVTNNTVVLSAASGSVSLTQAANSITPAVTITARDNSSIITTSNLALGNVAVSAGTFSASTVPLAAATINQATDTTIRVFGNTSFLSQGGVITLNNTGNNFGALTLNSINGAAAGANIALREAGTVNLADVQTGTAGTLAVNSQGGGIIQSGALGIITGGVSSFGAAGDITLNSTANAFSGGVAAITAGNAALTNSVNTVLVGGASGTAVGGAFSVRNTTAATQITQAGSLNITGATTLDAGPSGTVTLPDPENRFGAITLRAFGTGASQIGEATTLNLAGGSVANGPLTLVSLNGDVVTSGTAASIVNNALLLQANSGSVIVSSPLTVTGGLTVFAAQAKNLGVLSLSANLLGIAPTILPNTSNYTPPQP